jgi:hypothetical protein
MPGLVLLAAGVVIWLAVGQKGPDPAPDARAAAAPRAGGRAQGDVPRIDLARLDRPRPSSGIGARDIFDFGLPPATPPSGATPPRATPPPPPVAGATAPPVTAPLPPPVPPLNIKYIGAFEGDRGLKVAVLMTDRREVLTGQAGEVVANRIKIIRIGVESVDVQDVGSDQVRRIPLKGN